MKNEQVKCETCKHYIDKIDAQAVEIGEGWDGKRPVKFYHYYCPMHRKPYDVSRSSYNYEFEMHEFKFWRIIPEHQEQVNQDGTPYKEPKTKTKKTKKNANK